MFLCGVCFVFWDLNSTFFSYKDGKIRTLLFPKDVWTLEFFWVCKRKESERHLALLLNSNHFFLSCVVLIVIHYCWISDLFCEQLLESFQSSFPSLSFPPLPERGDFDLREVLESPYFFN